MTKEEKQRLLRAIEEDREFRYALMGLLGFKEILDRITRIEEGQQKLGERQQRLEERQQYLEERMLKLEERQQKLEERFAELGKRFAELQERFIRLEERQQKLEERQQRLEERMLKLEERILRVEEEIVTIRRTLEYTRRDLGALTEATYSRMAWEDLREEASSKGERVLRRGRNIRVNGYDIDLLLETDARIYVVEIKIQPNHHDVERLLEKAEAVRKAMGKRVEAVLAGTWIGSEVRRYCEEKNVRVLEY